MLLSNDGTLPLPSPARIAVIGPNADRAEALFGCYSFLNHVLAQHPGVEAGIDVPDGLEALRGRVPAPRSSPRSAARSTTTTGPGSPRPSRAAAAAEVAVLVVGDHAGLFGRGDRRRGLRPRRPRAARRAARAGRGRAGHRHARRAGAAHRPAVRGRLGPRAAARPWCRRSSPARRAAPRSRACSPAGSTRRAPAGQPAALGRRAAVHLPAPDAGRRTGRHQPASTPALPFGHGLSYTTFVHSDLEVDAQVPTDGHIGASVRVTNTGDRRRRRRRAALRARRRRLGDPPGGAARRVPRVSTSRPASPRPVDVRGADDPARVLRPRPRPRGRAGRGRALGGPVLRRARDRGAHGAHRPGPPGRRRQPAVDHGVGHRLSRREAVVRAEPRATASLYPRTRALTCRKTLDPPIGGPRSRSG